MTATELRTTGALPLALALAVLMALTRYGHGGASGLLPDASLAVFLLGGFCLARLRWFVLFLGVAALADQAAIRWGGVSDWCLTPAYAFLVPAYGAAWLSGWWVAREPLRGARAVLRVLVGFTAGSAAWFAVSNAGFYLFSGYFADLAAAEYAVRVLKYFPSYAAGAAFWLALAALLRALIGALLSARRARALA